MSILLENCSYVVTQNNDRKILRDVDIGIENGKIREIEENTDRSYEKHIDCSEKIVLPGLVNTHTHAGMSMMKGYSDDKELFKWLEDMWEIEDQLTSREVRIGSELSILEMIKTGTTTFMDMYFALDEVPEIVEESGIRAYLGWAVFNPEKSTQNGKPINNAEEFTKKHIDKKLVNPVIAPHSIYTCSDELIQESKELAKKHDVLFHAHAAETRKEVRDCVNENDERVIEHLDSLEVLDKDTSLAHVGWITKKEAKILGKKNVTVSHCPVSNMKLGTGAACPLPELKEAGANVTLGTDGAVSNNSLSMFDTMKFASLLQKHSRWDASVTSAQGILDMATRNPSSHLHQDTGKLVPGATSDIITMDLNTVQNTPTYNIVSNLVYSSSSYPYVVDSVIDGEIVMRDGDVLTMDEDKVRERVGEAVDELI